MSQIALVLSQFAGNRIAAIKILREGLGLAIQRIIDAAGSGQPVLVRRLFDRSDPNFAEQLLPVLEQLDASGVNYCAYELLDGQEFSKMNPVNLYRVDSSRLRSMIESRNKSMEDFEESF